MTTAITSGRPDAPYWIVGEAPGENEDVLGRPFVGVSGHEAYRMLTEAKWLPPGTDKHIIDGIYRHNFLPLDKALDAAGIYITNVAHERPPGNDIDLFFAKKSESKKEQLDLVADRYPRRPIREGLEQLSNGIACHRPTFILALGGTALWALTGLIGITKWRGSILPVQDGPVGNHDIKLIPTFHPADILREYPHRAIALHDLRRAKREREFPEIRKPTYHFIIRPTFGETLEWLSAHTDHNNSNSLPNGSKAADDNTDGSNIIAADIETAYGWRNLTGHIACIGFGDSSTSAISIPLMCVDRLDGYWTPEQEVAIVLAIRKLMTSRRLVFHKGIFDVMHIIAHWGFMPNFDDDNMVGQHVLFPGLLGGKIDPVTQRVSKRGSSLSLAFCASMYCEYYRFWKEDGKDWNQKEIPDEDGWWYYNCEDAVRTHESFSAIQAALIKSKLWEPYRFMMQLAAPVLNMMMRGIALDRAAQGQYREQVKADLRSAQEWIDTVCGHPLNTGSNGPTGQMQKLFYDDLRVMPVYKGRGRDKRKTTDSDALAAIAARVPLLAPLCHAIIDERSLAHFDENILSARLPSDRRLHSEINLTGTETMRFASTEDCFGFGLNLQNINRMPEE